MAVDANADARYTGICTRSQDQDSSPETSHVPVPLVGIVSIVVGRFPPPKKVVGGTQLLAALQLMSTATQAI